VHEAAIGVAPTSGETREKMREGFREVAASERLQLQRGAVPNVMTLLSLWSKGKGMHILNDSNAHSEQALPYSMPVSDLCSYLERPACQ
jgi:hypothetical protein